MSHPAAKTTASRRRALLSVTPTDSDEPPPTRPTKALVGVGGERHDQAARGRTRLTSNQGVVLADNQNSLHGGDLGPTLLEDFLLREKITHFDHERIPERIVHARGSAAHGYFECTRDCSAFTRAAFLGQAGRRTPLFTRFSTVAGGSGSVDTPRDVRGFAVKFYTSEGNFDLVGNNIPVFFIQDAMKFPDLIHAVKMEPDRGFPQAASAHATFWDFVSLVPESLHMLMWAMSDRTLPRSLRMIDGFGVHTFRLLNSRGQWRFVKFHWRSAQGVESTTWNEAVQLAGADPDYHRRDLWEAIDRGDFPRWELGLQVFDQELADSLPYDVLDATKLLPEELVPVQVVGHMVLDRNPQNFFAETEQVAFCPSHLVPGIDFSNDPLLQGRLFSYLDTQLSRLGGPNFHQLPINAPKCPFHNMQRDGIGQTAVPSGRVAYEPQSLDPQAPRESMRDGFTSLGAAQTGGKARLRSPRFADHYSQPRLFHASLQPHEQAHVAAAFAFELGKVEVTAIRERMLGHLLLINAELADRVAQRLGHNGKGLKAARPALLPQDLAPSPALSQSTRASQVLAVRHLALLVGEGVDDAGLSSLRQSAQRQGARVTLVAEHASGVVSAQGKAVAVDAALSGAPSCLYDAVALLAGPASVERWQGNPAACAWVVDAWRHLKPIALVPSARDWANRCGVAEDDAGVVVLSGRSAVPVFLKAVAAGKQHGREGQPGTDA